MKLSDTFVRSAPPGIYWDELKGFGLRVGVNRRAFLVRVGRGRNHRIGLYPLMSLADARAKAKELLAEKVLGKSVAKAKAFEDARTEFLEDCKERLRASTQESYRWHLHLFPWKRQSIADVSRKDIEDVLKKQKPSVKEHLDRIGRTFFSWCVRKEFIDRSPMEKMDKPPQGKSRERALSMEELGKVYRAAKMLSSPVERVAWLLLRLGQRPGETRRLRWTYFTETRLTLPPSLMKNGREQILPLTEATYLTVQSFPKMEGSPYVFPAARDHIGGRPTTTVTINTHVWKGFVKKCGTAWFTKHDLRRTVATRWAEDLQIPPHLIERLLHHVSGQVSGVAAIYNRALYLQELHGCMERWEAKLESL